MSKRQLKRLNRLSVAELKQLVARPDVVEMHDVTGLLKVFFFIFRHLHIWIATVDRSRSIIFSYPKLCHIILFASLTYTLTDFGD